MGCSSSKSGEAAAAQGGSDAPAVPAAVPGEETKIVVEMTKADDGQEASESEWPKKLAPSHPKYQLMEKFCTGLFDGMEGKTASVATDDCMFAPPGTPPMPLHAVLGMFLVFKTVWPDWVSVFWGVEENEDGTVICYTQQCMGKMQKDFPAMGPFPAVAMADCDARVLNTDVKLPVEFGRYKFNADGTLCAGSEFFGDIKEFEGSDVTPWWQENWNQRGDLSDVGFGAIFIYMGHPLPLPPPAPDAEK